MLRRGKEIYYHSGKKECDFLIKEGLKITTAIQVALHVDTGNYERKYGGLKEAIMMYRLPEGLLLTDQIEENREPDPKEGIKVMPVWKWLLS